MFLRTPELVKYSEFIALGAQIAASMIVPVVIGIYVDKYWQISPWGVITGAILGFGGMISIVIKLASRAGNTQYMNKKNRPGNDKI